MAKSLSDGSGVGQCVVCDFNFIRKALFRQYNYCGLFSLTFHLNNLTLIPDDFLNRPAGTAIRINNALWIRIAESDANHDI